MQYSKIPNMDDESLRSFLANKKHPLLLSFYAPWCSTSSVLEPALNEIAHDYQKRLQVSRLNIDENAHAPAEYGVRTIPHFILFDKGEIVASFSGAQPKTKIIEFIEIHLSS